MKLYCRPKKTADFLRDAVETRLRMYAPYIESWPQVMWVGSQQTANDKCFFSSIVCVCLCVQAMSILLLPHNIPDSLKHLSNLVDDIWYYAGDRSTDVSGFHHPPSLCSPLFTITHAISGLLPPRIPPTTTTTLPYYRAHAIGLTPSGSSHSFISKSLFCWEKKIIHVYSEHHFCPGDIVFMDVVRTLPVAVRAYKHNPPALFPNWRFFSCRWTGIPSGQHWRASITPLS